MTSNNALEHALNAQERRLLYTLDSPYRIQTFLNAVPYSCDPIYRSPLQVIRERKAHCFDGALFAAAALRRLGYPPLILDMLTDGLDDEHLLALFKVDGHWGAVAKSNTVVLCYREPVYRSLRELVMSYFDFYYSIKGVKTLRGYTVPLNLEAFDDLEWEVSDRGLERIADRTEEIRRFTLLTPAMLAGLSPVEGLLYEAGYMGAVKEGLFDPDKKT